MINVLELLILELSKRQILKMVEIKFQAQFKFIVKNNLSQSLKVISLALSYITD
jgi:hypothetical protein